MPSRGSDRRVRFGRRRRLLGLPVGAVLAAAAIGVLAVAVAPGGVAADPDAQAAAAVKVSIGDNFLQPSEEEGGPSQHGEVDEQRAG
jgi:hypothetical protein